MIYLDNAATTKVAKEVLIEMDEYHTSLYANSSSKHSFGQIISSKINQSKQIIANLLNCYETEVFFNSGSTEGINTILKGFVEGNIDRGNHIITTKAEHKAVLETCSYLENIGIEISYLDVDSNGLINIEQLKEYLRNDTILVSILWVNNETGVVQDIKKIGELVSKSSAKLFVDATQAVGKMPIDVQEYNIDMLCLSGHKFHGPKGIGAIYKKKNINIAPLLHGGGQENGLRSGTSNTPGIVGLAKACKISDLDVTRIYEIQKHLESSLIDNFDCQIVGKNVDRSPYISNIIFKNADADIILSKLKNLIISSGSACTSQIIETSHVLKSMGFSNIQGFGSLRFSFSRYTTKKEIDQAIKELKSVI